MAHWFNTKPVNKPLSLKEILVTNTNNYISGREVRLAEATKETFERAKRDFLIYSSSNYGYDYWLRPFSTGNNTPDAIPYRLLKQLSFVDRDEVLGRVAKMFREEDLECHADGDSIHLIWKPEPAPVSQ